MLLSDDPDLAAQYYRLRRQYVCNRHRLETCWRYGQLAASLARFSSLCSGFVHDLGNGLNAVQGKLESLSFGQLGPEQTRTVSQAKALCELSGWRIYSLAAVAAGPPVHPEPANLPEFIPRLLDRLTAVQPPAVQVCFQTDAPRLIVADYDSSLRLVLLELVLNAFEAMPGGGQVRVGVHKLKGDLAQVEIADTGPGFPGAPEAWFDLRFTTGPHRYGMGLYVARRIIERHGGTLTACPAPASGARVVIRLPVGNPEPEWDDQSALVRELEKLHDSLAEQQGQLEGYRVGERMRPDERLAQLADLFGQLSASTVAFVAAGLAGIRQRLAPLADQVAGQAVEQIRFILDKCDYCEALLGNVYALNPDRPVHLTGVDLNRIAAQAVRLMAWRAQPGTQLGLLAGALPPARADALLVTTALVNLLRNALDAAGQGGRVELETALAGHAAVVRVTNSGAAIPAAARGRVFDLDYTTRRERAFGVGLFVARAIATVCGGEIVIGDGHAPGARVELFLPVVTRQE